jgi:hypothetical protein
MMGENKYFPLSSVIRYYSVDSASEPTRSYTLGTSDYHSFVTLTDADYEYNQNVSFISGETDSDVRYVSIVFDYNSSLIEYIYYKNLGLIDENLYYSCDFNLIA